MLDTKNLTYLTMANAVADIAHFAKTVKLPFDLSGNSSPEKAVGPPKSTEAGHG